MLVCWSVGGGVGTSVVAAGLAVASERAGGRALLVDLRGDQPALFGVAEPEGPGLAGWLRAGPDVPADALERLEIAVVPGVALLPQGGPLEPDRVDALARHLDHDGRAVVVDAGPLETGTVAFGLAAAAERTLLVARACPVALRRLVELPLAPTGVVVVRERRRTVSWHEVAEAAGAPVVAELDIDPAVAAAVDAGLAHRCLPRAFMRVLGSLR